ncbi:putative low-complexity protein [Flammeovirgaceae bacterium 311]|nr:putative low-complexity protein [Flammeovirgaceae bacterium 311]
MESMEPIVHQHKLFENLNYSGKALKNREFEKCSFKACDFSSSDFSGNRFTDCTFTGCNMGLMKLNQTTMDGIFFQECKLIGVNFNDCADLLFSVRFENCLLDYASFVSKKMSKASFKNSSLKSAIFSNATLNKAIFDNTDLQGAVFNRTNLQEANFITAYNFTIDPELNMVKRAKFSQQSLPGLLAKYDLQVSQ